MTKATVTPYPWVADPHDADARAERYKGHNPQNGRLWNQHDAHRVSGNRRLVTIIRVEGAIRATQNISGDWRFGNDQLVIAEGLPSWWPIPYVGPREKPEYEPDDIERSRFLD